MDISFTRIIHWECCIKFLKDTWNSYPSVTIQSVQPVTTFLSVERSCLLFPFSFCQDPVDPASTVIVIRSLVPGGVAEKDGRLLPGDRLMFVNDVNLENSSLEEAVQALKGASSGTVRIGVAKPLPVRIQILLISFYLQTVLAFRLLSSGVLMIESRLLVLFINMVIGSMSVNI